MAALRKLKRTETNGDERSGITKRSITIEGRKTSGSLEDEFWHGAGQISRERQSNIAGFVRRINDMGPVNLSSVIRLFVLNHYRQSSGAKRPRPG